MKTQIIKSISVLAVLGTLVSCNQNSPAPAQPAPSNPTPTAPTNTLESTALQLIGHWYLDSTVQYISPTNKVVTKYGFNYVFTYPNDIAQHKEIDLKANITTSLTANALSSQSHGRELHSILWARNSNNDTISYTDQSPLTWAIVYAGNDKVLNAAGGYIRDITGNLLQTADNTSTVKSGIWKYWHRQ